MDQEDKLEGNRDKSARRKKKKKKRKKKGKRRRTRKGSVTN